MRAHSFSHVGITVADFNRSVKWYADVFGAPVVGVSENRGERLRTFFGVGGDDPSVRIGWLRVPGGGVIEIFEFSQTGEPAEITWNRPGPTHFSFNVRDTAKWHSYLVGKGVECLSGPVKSPRGHTFFFVKDPDGNLIELIDNKHFRAILRYLGPLGGVLFRRTMYRKYYE